MRNWEMRARKGREEAEIGFSGGRVNVWILTPAFVVLAVW